MRPSWQGWGLRRATLGTALVGDVVRKLPRLVTAWESAPAELQATRPDSARAFSGRESCRGRSRLRAAAECHPTSSVTSPHQGVIDPKPMPDWLSMELAPSGKPPELEASMKPEVRQMWENTRAKMHSLVQRH